MAQNAPTKREKIGFAAGVAAGALFALGVYLMGRYCQPHSGLLLLSILLVPAAASALAVLVANIQGEGATGRAVVMSFVVVTVLLIGSGIVLREGAICLAMAAPIFYGSGMLGGAWAPVVSKAFGRSRASAFVLLPVLLLPFEQQDSYPTIDRRTVSQIEIDAPLAVVWRNAVQIPDIAQSEHIWTPTHDLLGVPKPADARLVRIGVSLVRQAVWEGDVRFNEVITDWRPLRSVSWRSDIPEAAADKLLDEHLRLDEGYLQIQTGRYDFESLGPNRTRLTLVTSYAARTPFNAYAELWGRLLLGDIHRNVLHIIELRAESQARHE